MQRTHRQLKAAVHKLHSSDDGETGRCLIAAMEAIKSKGSNTTSAGLAPKVQGPFSGGPAVTCRVEHGSHLTHRDSLLLCGEMGEVVYTSTIGEG